MQVALGVAGVVAIAALFVLVIWLLSREDEIFKEQHTNSDGTTKRFSA